MLSVNPYIEYSNTLCVAAPAVIISELNPEGLVTKALWDKWTRVRSDGLKQRGGNGRVSLFALDAVPEPHYSNIIAKYGNPRAVTNPLEPFFVIDAAARAFFDRFQFDDGTFLKEEQKQKYTLSASVLGALGALESARRQLRKGKGATVIGMWDTLANDVKLFNEVLKTKYNGMQHREPENPKRLCKKLREFQQLGYDKLVDRRNKNQSAQKVTPMMLNMWKDIFAGQRSHKPTHVEVHARYVQFLKGAITVVNNEDGTVYDHQHPDMREASESTIKAHQSFWENRVSTHKKRAGDRAQFMQQYQVFHKLKQPEYAGSIISIDDRQPPFEYMWLNPKTRKTEKKRMWFYICEDLASQAWTVAVYGDTKEGIIEQFYKQMLRNYTALGLPMPHELECESSLNSSFRDTFLQPGAMFQEVRIEANNPRGKRIERSFGEMRYRYEKHNDGFVARPFARSESNQKAEDKSRLMTREEIIQTCLGYIEQWNNELHDNQTLHPGMTRWEVFLNKQHPALQPTNWAAILPHLGKRTRTSMKAGRVILKDKHRVVGFNGEVALGERLINVMKQIEGEAVDVLWLDDEQGEPIRSLVYDRTGRLVCELLGDLAYSRSTLERTAEDDINRALTSAYAATVQSFIKTGAEEINQITIIENETRSAGSFQMPGLTRFVPRSTEPEIITQPEDNNDLKPVKRTISTNIRDRF